MFIKLTFADNKATPVRVNIIHLRTYTMRDAGGSYLCIGDDRDGGDNTFAVAETPDEIDDLIKAVTP